ncbi:MAG: shikimate dehydrogenase [Puniceicoccales bacterium]|jgi:shikimate dehydrogenase|nr:shikimate dehydrogenase [Puniceicoccales bacterium]
MSQTEDWEPVLTLDALRRWANPATSLAVVGMPISHSLSPRMHNAALAALGLPEFASWKYFKFEIASEALATSLPLFHQKRFHGLNLTLPHKVLACQQVTQLSAEAEAIGAVNTLVREKTGYAGHNTDGLGFARALREEFGLSLQGADVVLFGAGGAARSVAAQALREKCRCLWIGNREPQRLSELLMRLQPYFPRIKTCQKSFSLNALPSDIPKDAIVVNTTSLGLKPHDPSPVPQSFWRPEMHAYDIVYGTSETAFLRNARTMGARAADGTSMLYWQGALAFELWTGHVPSIKAMRDALART